MATQDRFHEFLELNVFALLSLKVIVCLFCAFSSVLFDSSMLKWVPLIRYTGHFRLVIRHINQIEQILSYLRMFDFVFTSHR